MSHTAQMAADEYDRLKNDYIDVVEENEQLRRDLNQLEKRNATLVSALEKAIIDRDKYKDIAGLI